MVSTTLILIPYPPSLSAREEDETFVALHNSQLQAMLKRFVHSLGRVAPPTDREQRSKKSQVKKGSSKSQVRGTKVSPDISLRSNDFVVRIVHKGGQQEVYHHALRASKLMAKYPGMCVALPEVFRDPHQSVLEPEELLLLGLKYIIMSPREVEKLKRKHPQQGKDKEPNGVVTQEPLEAKIIKSPSGHKSVPNGVLGQEMVETRTTQSPSGCKVHENSKVKEVEGEEKVDAKMNLVPGGGAVEEPFCCAKEYYLAPKDQSTRHTKRRGIRGNKPFVPPLPKTRFYRGLGWEPRLPTVQEISP